MFEISIDVSDVLRGDDLKKIGAAWRRLRTLCFFVLTGLVTVERLHLGFFISPHLGFDCSDGFPGTPGLRDHWYLKVSPCFALTGRVYVKY
jgi:hypothetical protein